MALGALIGAYQEDDSGGLRALLPLAGRSLIEYQARCLAAAGAAPLVVLVERVPPALNEAFERLRSEGISVIAVSDGSEAASRFEAGNDLILLADGIAPDMGDLERLIVRLGDLSGVERTRTTVALSVKWEDRPPPAPAPRRRATDRVDGAGGE